MKKVYKYEMIPNDYIEIEMPAYAKVLHVDVQHGMPCLWALVNPNNPLTKRKFRFAGTGHPITDRNLFHIGTFQMDGGNLIFHIFETL